MGWLCVLLCALALVTAGLFLSAQEPPEQPAEEQPLEYQFFSGQVAAFSPEKITVVRNATNTEPEERTFLLTPETRIEGKLKVRARVTVGYQTGGEGDVATRVIVRGG